MGRISLADWHARSLSIFEVLKSWILRGLLGSSCEDFRCRDNEVWDGGAILHDDGIRSAGASRAWNEIPEFEHLEMVNRILRREVYG